jgi:hypothetical protein
MSSHNIPAGVSRRAFVTGGLAATIGLLAGDLIIGTSAEAASPDLTGGLQLSGSGFSIIGTADGKVTVVDGNGTARIVLPGYRLTAAVNTGGTPSIVTNTDGTQSIVVDYVTNSASITMQGTFTPVAGRLRAVYDIWAPDGTTVHTGKMRRQVVPAGIVESFTRLTDWTRDARGGVPFEVQQSDGVYIENFTDLQVFIRAEGTNPSWGDSNNLSCPAVLVEPGHYRAQADLAVGDLRPKLAGALISSAALSADVWTDRPYNIWDSTTAPAVVHAAAFNGAELRDVSFVWKVTDFNGQVIAARTTTVSAGSVAIVSDDLSVALPARGIFFVEVTASAGTDTSYTRTNIAMLPSHTYTEGVGSSFGISANFLLDTDDERALLRRIGMRWSRNNQFTSAQLSAFGFTQNRLKTPPAPDAYDNDPVQKAAYINGEVSTAISSGAVLYELANEWNMKGGVLQGVYADDYVNKWLTPFHAAFVAAGASTQLMSVGLAGMDHVFATKMFAAGAGSMISGFGLHPGRGNFTPDFAPTPDQWLVGSTGTYWNFLGSVREARRILDEQPQEIELWLTEAYACTKPNSWWYDTHRHAAENVVLSHALALSEGVRNVQWYQFYDSVKANPTGATADNNEYHYGLVLRDHSPKPALLAHATIAEALDEATFVRWLEFDDADVKGLLFETPRGPLSILWSRAEGYVLNADHGPGSFYASPEPWVDPWPQKTTLLLPAALATVTETDSIGQERSIVAQAGVASVTVDGAPRLYYGLEFPAQAS